MEFTQTTDPPLVVNLHGLKLAFQSFDIPLRERFITVYGHLPRPNGPARDVFISWHIHHQSLAPLPPPDTPLISAGELVSYYGTGELVTIRLPRYGLINLDLTEQRLVGAITPNCLEVYGAFEDVLMISLAPFYRRKGWFPLHAFAALAPNGRAALIAGPMGSGKTTTGLALLSADWKLLSNDSPLLTIRKHQILVLAYPGRLSAFDDSLARFEDLKKFIPLPSPPAEKVQAILTGPEKRFFRAEEAFAEPWASSGMAGGIFFPQVVPGLGQSALVEVKPKEAILKLVPQTIEGWDKAMIAPTLQILNQLVAQVPCYTLRLSPHLAQLPQLIAAGMER